MVLFLIHLALIGTVLLTHPSTCVANTPLGPGRETGEADLSVITLQANKIPWIGNREIVAVKLIRDQWSFRNHSFHSRTDNRRLSAREWLEETRSVITINAGQFDTDYRHLGWFIRDGTNIGSRQHPIWKGIFASRATDTTRHPTMTIVDLQVSPQTLQAFPYREAVQSLMLFDSQRTIRVNRTGKFARRCIVAVDTDNNTYLIVTRGECTLWDLASYLLTCPLNLDRAMSMDGGAQAQIAIHTPTLNLDIPSFQIPIPCVIGFIPESVRPPEPIDPNR
ncbi:phosphodiester glycosidase family protein [bacterium]|nr:phosphodiester glycosidase family protein [candidate division CSSED10-310 bacterium]